jgi:hypothetical protein
MQGAQQIAQQVSQAAESADEKALGEPKGRALGRASCQKGDSRRSPVRRRVTPPMPEGHPIFRTANVPSRRRRARSPISRRAGGCPLPASERQRR